MPLHYRTAKEWAQGGREHWDKMGVCTTLIFATTRMMELLPGSDNLSDSDMMVIRFMARKLESLESIKVDMKADYHNEKHVINLYTVALEISIKLNDVYATCIGQYGRRSMDDWKTSFLELQGTIDTAVRYLGGVL